MIKKILSVFLAWIVCCSVAFAIGAEPVAFDPDAAIKSLDRMNSRYSSKEMPLENLKSAINQLTSMQNEAKQCVKNTEAELNDVDKLLKEAPRREENAKLNELLKYLNDKKSKLTQTLSGCRLFVIRSNEAIATFDEAAQKLSAGIIFKKETNFFQNLQHLSTISATNYAIFNSEKLRSELSPAPIDAQYLLPFFGAIFISISIALLLSYFFARLEKKPIAWSSKPRIWLAFIVTMEQVIIIVLPLTVICIGLYLSYFSLAKTPTLVYLLLILLIYTIAITSVRMLFTPRSPAKSVFDLSSIVCQKIARPLYFIITVGMIEFIVYLLFSSQNFTEEFTTLTHNFFITLIIFLLFWLTWRLPLIAKSKLRYISITYFASVMLTLFLGFLLVAEWLGHVNLVNYLLTNFYYSILLIFFAILIHKLVRYVFDTFESEHSFWRSFRHSLGVRRRNFVLEVVLIRFLCYFVIWTALIIYLSYVWGISESGFRTLTMNTLSGFTIAGVHFSPTKIALAILVFAVLSLFTRWIRYQISQASKLTAYQATRDAIAPLAGYVGFALSLFIALMIAGINFTGIAIIIGALSVGIGFGLQNIVNNFVSGLILLIERPIKVGDRIIVGDTEGFVSKISIRSTQIHTVMRSDVIVPNSELVSSQVTNLMFKDMHLRVTTKVGVAYGSDVALVKKILLQVAAENENVEKEAPDAPLVLFRNFGDSNLEFELWCIIRDVNQKYIVQSDLNMAIDKLFRENNITIAFPQQDLHIKEIPKPPKS